MSIKENRASYLQGITSLAVDATLGVTDLVETMHKRVVHPPLLPSTPIQHLITKIASFTYKNIKLSTKLVGNGLDKTLEYLAPFLGEIKPNNKNNAIQAVLNGIIGDYLVQKENPLSIKMQFIHLNKTISFDCNNLCEIIPNINGKILLMVHGSCMNDFQWTRQEHNHGLAIAKELHKTPIYLNYNSGLHISENGKQLNVLLENLLLNWPVPLQEITIIAHSMGGLVARSAIYYSNIEDNSWSKYLNKIVFLGTPHHGAPLEKIGNYIDVILESIPYSKPFARLGKIRSSGITDLRYGNLVDQDWQNQDRFKLQGDKRENIPLPKKVESYSIAAAIGKETKSLTKIVGDNLVDVKSALGQHSNPNKSLNFKKENTWIAYENSHLDLLNNPEVYSKIKAWFTE
ncbi:MAG: hypothetical protein WAO74_08315 [Polaribacter sp.]|uniref:lipase family alpha/beta hydrolase n=1 Tax=Polaribacter sp. TaxID=1920175 RepID=UPI003BAFC079